MDGGGGSWDMVVSLLHRVNDCQYMYIYKCFTVIYKFDECTCI